MYLLEYPLIFGTVKLASDPLRNLSILLMPISMQLEYHILNIILCVLGELSLAHSLSHIICDR